MIQYLQNYMPTTYVDLCASKKGEGHDWFRIKEGDLVQVRNVHELDSDEWGQVYATTRQMVLFHKPGHVYEGLGQAENGSGDIFRVRRQMKTCTIGATFPCTWGGSGDLIPFKYTANTLRVFDMKLKIKWLAIDGVRTFEAFRTHDGKKYEEYPMVSGMIPEGSSGYVECWNDEFCNRDAHTTRESNHWADAIVRVIANIY